MKNEHAGGCYDRNMKSRKILNLSFTQDVRTSDTFRFELDSGVTAEVFGDPENASYEWRLVDANGLVEKHSDCGYGSPSIAMRDALVTFYGNPELDMNGQVRRTRGESVFRPLGEGDEKAGTSAAYTQSPDGCR